MNIYVGNVPYAATEEDLEQLFSEYGRVVRATIIHDRDTGQSKGFGFVEMENQADGVRAIEDLDGYRLMGRPLKVNPARPPERRREPHRNRNRRSQEPDSSRSKRPSGGTFYNPYTFVPSLPRKKIKAGEFAGDFDPLKKKLDHSSLQAELWTGHIPIKLTTVTPLVLLKGDGEERESAEPNPYDVLDYIPESSLRGMLRSAYEVVTNSRYACFRNNDRLAYRMETREALKLIPAIIENGVNPGEVVAHLYPGTSGITPQRPRGPMYAAMLDKDAKYVDETEPKTRDEVWAEIVLCQHDESPRYETRWYSEYMPRRNYHFWKVVKIWLKSKHANIPGVTSAAPGSLKKPSTDSRRRQSHYAPLNPEDRRIVSGRVFITNENMGNKHDERIFFVDGQNANNPIMCDVTNLKEAWRMRIQSYRDAHSESDIFGRSRARNKPWQKIGRDPGDTAWSPHIYEDGRHKDRWDRDVRDALDLQAGEMVYARCEFNSQTGAVTGIKDLFPVMISRELYENSPEELLDSSLQPAKKLNELSPADRLFGWAPQEKQDSNQDSQGGYKSRVRVVCDDGPGSATLKRFGDEGIPLTILGQPKPAQGRFYVAKDDNGTPQDDKINKTNAGYNKANEKGLRGRKQYWHHRGLEAENAPNYWDPLAKNQNQEYLRTGGKRDTQNRSITGWIEPQTEFKASLYVQNLQPQEVGALLWLLSLPADHYFRLGYGKPLGFGSLKMEIDTDRLVDDCLPLGTGNNWKAYYADLNARLQSTKDADLQGERIAEFKASMVAAYNKFPNFEELPFISDFLQILKGPVGDARIHYPRPNSQPDPEGKNFLWFVANEKGSKRSLPKVTDEKGLPYRP